MEYDYFVAGRYRNKENVLSLVKQIRKKGKTVYCFIESAASIKHVGEIDADGENAMREFEKTPDWWNSNKVNEVFQQI